MAMQRIDQALKRHYESLGEAYNMTGGKGLFTMWCHSSGYDTNKDVETELKEEPGDCMLCDFDDNFPLSSTAVSKAERQNEIHKILLQAASVTYDAEFVWNAAKSELDELEKACREQLPTLVDRGGCEYSIWKMFALSSHPNNAGLSNFLVNYVDLWTTQCALSSHSVKVEKWLKENKYGASLKEAEFTCLRDAMTAYSNRTIPRMSASPSKKMKGSLQQLCGYFVRAAEFINFLLETQQETITPFSVDFMITVDAAEVVIGRGDEEDDDDDDDDDGFGDDEDIKHGDQNVYQLPRTAQIAKELLVKKNKECVGPLNVDYKMGVRPFGDAMKVWKRAKEHDDKSFPHRRRISVFVDRRKGLKGKDDEKNEPEDEMIMFEPVVCGEVPKKALDAWYTESALQFLMPSDSDEKEVNCVNALMDDGGKLMTLSFHVKEKDKIKCYLIWTRQTIRFFGKHMRSLLPRLFKNDAENEAFAKSKELDSMCETFDKIVVNAAFDLFVAKYGETAK